MSVQRHSLDHRKRFSVPFAISAWKCSIETPRGIVHRESARPLRDSGPARWPVRLALVTKASSPSATATLACKPRSGRTLLDRPDVYLDAVPQRLEGGGAIMRQRAGGVGCRLQNQAYDDGPLARASPMPSRAPAPCRPRTRRRISSRWARSMSFQQDGLGVADRDVRAARPGCDEIELSRRLARVRAPTAPLRERSPPPAP